MKPFDDEWLGAAADALRALPEVEGADATIDYVVTGGPKGRTTITVDIEKGRFTAISIGRSADPDIVISLKYEDVPAIVTGAMSSDAGYMNGALKVEGAHARWMLDLRPVRLAAIEALAPVMATTTA